MESPILFSETCRAFPAKQDLKTAPPLTKAGLTFSGDPLETLDALPGLGPELSTGGAAHVVGLRLSGGLLPREAASGLGDATGQQVPYSHCQERSARA
jgi:hypothetical protein